MAYYQLSNEEVVEFSRVLVRLAKDKRDLSQVATSPTEQFILSRDASGAPLTIWGPPLFADYVQLTGMDTPSLSASSWKDGSIPGGFALVGLLERLNGIETVDLSIVPQTHTLPTDHNSIPHIFCTLLATEPIGSARIPRSKIVLREPRGPPNVPEYGTASGPANRTLSGPANGTASVPPNGTASGPVNRTASGTVNVTASRTPSGPASGPSSGPRNWSRSGPGSGPRCGPSSGPRSWPISGAANRTAGGTANKPENGLRINPRSGKQANSPADRQEGQPTEQPANQHMVNAAGEKAAEGIFEQPIFLCQFIEWISGDIRYLTVHGVVKSIAVHRYTIPLMGGQM
eukprot:scpid75652/ scgid21063/ 